MLLALPCMVWGAATLCFIVAGRDEPECSLCSFMPEPRGLNDAENAYSLIKEYVAQDFPRRNLPELWNIKSRRSCRNGSTNLIEAAAEARPFIAAESNTFATVRGVIASRGMEVPFDETVAANESIVRLLRIRAVYEIKAICEATAGDVAAGRATLMELYAFGRFLMVQDSFACGISGIVGGMICLAALEAAESPLFVPSGDEAWRALLRERYLALLDGDAARIKMALKRTLAGYWRRYAQQDSHLAAVRSWLGPLRFLMLCPGYVDFAFQPNRCLNAHRTETERFCRKMDEGRYDIGYAGEFGFGHVRRQHGLRPLSRNWLGEELMPLVGYGGCYVAFFRNRFIVSASAVRLACRSYKARHGAYPEKLDALVPEFLAEIPRDPFDGEPLRYDAVGRYIWTKGPEGRFGGRLRFGPDGSPAWTHSSHRRNCAGNFVLLDPKGM